MKAIKRRYVMVNYDTGEIVQVNKPMTKRKALKIFEWYLTDISDFEILENMKQIRGNN